MKHNSFKYIIGCFFIALLISACSNESMTEKEGEGAGMEKTLTLHLPRFNQVDVATRMAGSPDERRISRVALVAYRGGTCVGVEMVYASDGNIKVSSEGTVSISLNKLLMKQDELPLQKGDEVYVLCNPSMYDESELLRLPALAALGIEETTNVRAPCLLHSPLTSDDKGYLIPMWGCVKYGESAGTLPKLERSIAKLTLELEAGITDDKKVEYKLKNVPIYGTMKSGCFKSTNVSFYHDVTNGGHYFPIEEPNYLFAFPHSTFGRGYNNDDITYFKQYRSCIILKVGDDFYRMDLFDNQRKEYFDLERNRHYKFHIKEITGRGYATEDDAFKHPGSNIVYDVTVENGVGNIPAWTKRTYTNGQYSVFLDLEKEYMAIPFVAGQTVYDSPLEDRVRIMYRKEDASLPTPSINTITYGGTGMSAGSGTLITVPASSSSSNIRCRMTYNQFTEGKVTVRLANIQFEIPVYRRFDADCHYMVYPFENVASARVMTPDAPWIELSEKCESNLSYRKEEMSQNMVSSSGNLYVHLDENLNTSYNGTQLREAIVEVTDKGGNTVHYCFRQNGIDYVGSYGGYQDEAPNEYGLGAERLTEYIGNPVDYNITGQKVTWGFNGISYNFASNEVNGWETTWELARDMENSGVIPQGEYAARICYEKNRDLDGDGVLSREEMKWYLPAKNQLLKVFSSPGVTKTPAGYYLTSQEYSNNQATRVWKVNTNGTSASYASKTELCYVRCVRDMPKQE